jgi:mannose-6-phosphate isomerase-like protein (cupin superfamily)
VRTPKLAACLPLLVCAAVVACAPRAVRVVAPSLEQGLEAFLDTHPLAPGQAVRIDEVARTASASYHLAQVRGQESPHRHRVHDLTVFLLRGRGTLTLGSARMPLSAGDAAVIPREAPHWFANDGSTPSVTLVIFSPPLDEPDNVR